MSWSWTTCQPIRWPAFVGAIGAAGPASCPCRHTPDLNPIEQVFAKIKAFLREAGARTRDILWDTVGAPLNAFGPDKCRNYLINSGYECE